MNLSCLWGTSRSPGRACTPRPPREGSSRCREWFTSRATPTIQTGEDGELGIDEAIMARENDWTTASTISVPSVDEFGKRVERAGRQVVSLRQTIPGIGYHSYCLDSEGNVFGILEEDASAE